jgi:TolB-like protein
LLHSRAAAALLLAGYEDVADEFRAWLEQLRADAVGRLARALERGYSDLNLTSRERRRMAEAALRLDHLDEDACRAVMRLAAEGGEIAPALRAYAELYEALGAELDMEPCEATQALVAAIKSGQLDPVPPPREAAPAAPARPSSHAGIVVLPFVADGDATTADLVRQFAEGVEEGIVHVLSGLGELFVIARGTARTFAGRNIDPREVGQALGVDYVLSGRVIAGAEGMRVCTELAESSAGRVIRTDRYDAMPQGLFALQDRMADDLVGVIAPAVKAHELARAKRKAPESITAYDLMLQGVELQYALEESSFAAAGARLYEAIARDPHYAPAHAHAATWHNFRIGQGWSPRPTVDAAHAARCAARALELDRNNAVALAIRGQVLSFNGRHYQEARDYLDRAIALGPSSVLAWTLSSATHSWTGNGSLGVEHAARAVKLSPFDPFVFFAEHMLSQSHYMQGNYDTAIELARSVERRNPRLTSNLRTMAAALVANGAIDEARHVANAMLSLEPSFRLTAFERRTPLCDAVRGDYVARLRRAGLPD